MNDLLGEGAVKGSCNFKLLRGKAAFQRIPKPLAA
jgi:hypothetical protein